MCRRQSAAPLALRTNPLAAKTSFSRKPAPQTFVLGASYNPAREFSKPPVTFAGMRGKPLHQGRGVNPLLGAERIFRPVSFRPKLEVKSLLEVAQQVLSGFDADRKADQAVGDADGEALLARDSAVAGRGGMDDE